MEIENTTTDYPMRGADDSNDASKEINEEEIGEKSRESGMGIELENTALTPQDDDDSDSKPSGLSVDSLIALRSNSDGPEPQNGDNDGEIGHADSPLLTPVQGKRKRGRPRNDAMGARCGKEMKDELKILRKLSEAKNDTLDDAGINEQKDCFANLNKDIGFTPEFKIVRKIRTRDRFNNPRSRGKSKREFLTPRLKKSRSENGSYSYGRSRGSGRRGRRGRPGTGHSGYKRQKRAHNGRFIKGKKDSFGVLIQDFEEYYSIRDEEEDGYAEGFRYKRYNDLAVSLKYLKYMNWDNLDPRTHKTSPFHSPPLTVMSFWFLICCQYFPKFDPAFFDYILTKTKKILDKKNLKFDFMFKKRFKKKIKKSIFIENLKKSEDEKLRQEAKTLDYEQVEELAKELAARIGGERSEGNTGEIGNNINFKKRYSLDQDIGLNKVTRYLERTFGHLIEERESRLKDISILKKLPLDCLINSLEDDLAVQECKRNTGLERLRGKVKEMTREESYFEGTYSPNHALKDLFPRFNEELEFLDRLEENQHNSYGEKSKNSPVIQNQKNNSIQVSGIGIRPSTSGGHDHKKSDDYDCQICSDGDYSEDNLIVFCARCNVSVHQKCYGLVQIPEGNWICDLCKAFGPDGQYLPCPFCTKRGGAMRRAGIHAFDEYWKNLNLEYFEQMKLSDGETHLSRPVNPYYEDQSAIENDDNLSINSKNFTEFLYYNFHKLPITYSEEELTRQPKPYKTWVHLSCCHWIPEIYFGKDDLGDMEEEDNSEEEDKQSVSSDTRDKANQLEIKGIDEMDKRRYNLKCEICDKKQGAAVQCAQRKCQLSYHVECARRANIFIEPPDSENPCFIIYCEKHAPLMIKRELEAKRKTTIQEITKFCRTIEKYYQSYKYKFDPIDPNDKSFFYLKDEKKRSKIYERQNNADYAHPLYKDIIKDKFMREVEYELNKFPEFGNIITLQKKLVEEKDGSIKREYEFMNYEPPRKRFLYNKIPKNHKVWSRMAKSRGWQVKGVYKKYRRILAGSKEDPIFGLEKKRIKFKKPKYKYKFKTTMVPYREVKEGVLFVENKESKGDVLTIFEGLSDELFCECRRPWKGEIMIGNLSDLKHVECSGCNSWFHPECLGVVEKDEIKLNQMVITCSKCKDERRGLQASVDDAFLGKRDRPFDEREEFKGLEVEEGRPEEFKIPVYSPIKKLKLTAVDVGEGKMMVVEDRESTQDYRESSSLQILGTPKAEGTGGREQGVLSLPSKKENLGTRLNRVTSGEKLSMDSEVNEVKQTNLKEFFVSKKSIPHNIETNNSGVSSPGKTPTSTSV